jgi:hypothetical protein
MSMVAHAKNDLHGTSVSSGAIREIHLPYRVLTTLDREGYSASQIQGPLLKRQLTDLIKTARPAPLDRDLARGVPGN